MMNRFLFLSACLTSVASAFVVVQQQPASRFDTSCQALTVPGMWGSGLNFGKGDFAFYKSFDQFLKPFAEEDREAFPEVFNLPKGVYEVSLTKVSTQDTRLRWLNFISFLTSCCVAVDIILATWNRV